MENEEWRDVPGYEGCYQVSSFGRVKSVRNKKNSKKGQILKDYPSKGRVIYRRVTLCNGIKKDYFYIHRLVAQTFLPNPKNKPCVDHIDGNPSNNVVENLRWVTTKENCNNPISRERNSKAAKKRNVGLFGILSKSAKKVVCVETQKTYYGTFEAERETGVSRMCISHVLHGRNKTAGGYHWEFAGDKQCK